MAKIPAHSLTVVALVVALTWAPLNNVPMSASSQTPAPSGPLKIVIIDGDEAANVVQEKMAAEPVIEVRDDQDRKVAGAVVRFKIRKAVSNRLSAAFRGGKDEVRTLTDAAGQARAGTLTPLEPGPFDIDVEVTRGGKTATATLRHRNYATAADARADGRQPVQRTAAAGVAAGAGAANAGGPAGAAGGAGASGGGAAAAAGRGLSLGKMALIGAGAAGVGAIALVAGGGKDASTPSTSTAPAAPPGRVTGVTASVSSGLMAATSFAFSAQTADFAAGALTYRWDFGDSTSSTDASPTKVYAAAGTYTVAVTVSDTRQSARSEMTVTVYSLTGRWLTPNGSTYVFTQSGAALTGTTSGIATSASTSWTFTNCPLSGSVRGSAPMVVFNRPECRNGAPGTSVLVVGDFRLDLSANGQTLSGEFTQPSGTLALTMQRQ